MTSTQPPERPIAATDIAAQLAERLVALDELETLPLAEHPEVYQQLHADLQATLAEIETA